MVTNVKEGKTKKCEQYWPEGGSGKSYGPFNVSIVEENIFADYTIRNIKLVVIEYYIVITIVERDTRKYIIVRDRVQGLYAI